MAGIWRNSPVAGLRPTRPYRSTFTSFPRPGTVNSPSSRVCAAAVSTSTCRKAWICCGAAFICLAMKRTNCVLVILGAAEALAGAADLAVVFCCHWIPRALRCLKSPAVPQPDEAAQRTPLQLLQNGTSVPRSALKTFPQSADKNRAALTDSELNRRGCSASVLFG